MEDKRDEIIRTQLDVIETLIQNNMRRVADDFWGAPAQPTKPTSGSGSNVTPKDAPKKVDAPKQSAEKAPAQENAEQEPLPVENIEDLKAELNALIGLYGVKREVNNLINMVTVHKLRK